MNFINFIKDWLKQTIEDIFKDWPNQIKGNTVLNWWKRIIIAVFFFSFSLGLAGYLLFCTPLKEHAKEYVVLIAVVFTFINGIGIFIIRTADRKKEFNDTLFSQRNSRLLDAIKLISQKNENSGGSVQVLIRFAFYELIALSQFPDFKERIDLFTSRNRFKGFDLSGLDLSHFNFIGSELQGAHLRDTKLIKAKLNHADFAVTILEGANLAGADLIKANLINADLRGAKLDGADFSNAKLYMTDLRGTDWESAIWGGVNLEDAIRCDADLEKFKK